MENSPKVSVILPTYNRGNIIHEAIKSVLAQTYSPWELIIADDCSNDNTSDICLKLASEDPRIRYYQNQENLGLPRNRNMALSHVKGDLVLFIEDDMVLDEECISILVETYQSLIDQGFNVGSICPALITKHKDIGQKRSLFNYVNKQNEEKLSSVPCYIDQKTGLIYRNFSTEFSEIVKVEDCHSCSLYPREVFDQFQYEENAYQGSYTGEESDLHFRMRKSGYELYFQPKAFMYHNVEETGGCRLPLYKWSYYFVRNHSVFLMRNYGKESVIMIPRYLFFLMEMVIKYYLKIN
jgi:glycosyltransferase involved in cell wall biosynthesis